MSKRVYLAGPISGLDYNGATEWRNYAKQYLKDNGNIEGYSPMRGKEFLKHITEFKVTGYDENPISNNRAIMTRDRFDATRADVLLVNFLGTSRISIGTVMEIAWADLSRIPIVMVMEKGNIHEHGMILEAIGYRVDTLDEALDIICLMLNT